MSTQLSHIHSISQICLSPTFSIYANKLAPRPTANGGVDCKHGPSECIGNIIELCAHELYPDPKIYLGFVMCLTKDYPQIPDRTLIEDCALEHAIDFNKLNECAARDETAHGIELLRNSVQRSAEVRLPLQNAGVIGKMP
ncbi:hypothetical protein V8C43DRAFT_259809 [Trichoderma afarasin]